MKKQLLLITLLMAMFAPLTMNAQDGTLKKCRARSARPELESNTMMTSSNDKGNRDATYEMVTSDQSDWSGNYILGINYSTDYVIAFDGSLMSSSIYGYTAGGIAELTADGNTITSIGDAALLSIAPITYNGSTYYTIQINGNNYLGSSTSGFATNTSANSSTYYWNISYSNSGMILYSVATTNSYRIRFFEETDSSGDNYVGFSNTSNLAYSGSTFEYYNITLYKETTSGGGQEQGLTVANGTGTNSEIPFYGLYADDNYQHTQTIYPASMLTDMQGGQITKLTYYLSSSVTKNYGSTFEVRLGTTTSTSFGTGTVNYLSVSGSPVYSGTLSVSGTTVVFDFSNSPYTYTEGNLVVDVRITALGSGYNSTSFYGESGSTNYSVKNRNTSSLPTSTGTAVTFMPKTTFTYTISNTYTLTTSANPSAGGTVTPNGTNTYNGGTSVQVNATANTGYTFSGWILDGASVGSTNPYTLTMNDDHTLVANFTALPQYNITVNATTGGTVSGGGTYYQGEQATLTATANSGYSFAGWQLNGSIVSTDNPYTITVNGNATYTAVFETLAQHNITVTQPEHGTISASSTTAYMGDVITLTATPETGYFLAEWIVEDASNNTITVTNDQFTMPNSNVTVTATFTQGFHVTLNQTPNGTISADQTTNLQPGDIVTLTATPDNDCVFVAWYIFKDGNPRDVIAAVNNSWFFMPSSNVTVQAVFVTEEEHEQTVGGGDNTNANLPTNVYMKYSLTQQIYTAAEIGYTGKITAIAFKANGTATRSLEVYMAHTDLSAFSSTSSWETMGSVSKVFSGSVSFSSTDWTTITLDTPFEYDGTSNLNICVADRTGEWVSTITFNTYSTSANRALYINDDNTDYGAGVGYAQTLSGYSGTQSTSNNQIKFTIKVAGSAESLTISPDEISDFSYVEGQGPSEIHKLDIVGVDLENDITITAPTNFEVCLTENGTYTSTVTVPRETGSKGRGVTTWDFEGSMEGWTTIDADGDGNNWILGSTSTNVYCASNPFANGAGYNGSSDGLVTASYSNYLGVLTPDNWIVSPQVTLGGSFSMWTKPYQAQYPNEHFGIYVSTSSDPTNTSSYILLNEWTAANTNWAQYSVDLSAFANQSGYIAIRHFNCSDVYVMLADNFVLDTDAAISVEMPVTITPATVFVRMKDNLNRGTYSGTLTASAGTGDNLNGSVSLSGEVIAPSYNITLSANPTEGGSVAGAGTYTDGTQVTVSVISQRPYQFINWTENGTVVSTNASYTFTVTADRALVANFGFTKDITGYGTSDGGYYLIASPLASNVYPTDVTNMIAETATNYDLYRFNQRNSATEWENYKQNHFTTLENGKGYLYANKSDVTLVFMGTAYSGNGVISLTQDAENTTRGNWNLVGNPYPETANIGSTPYYKMKADGSDIESTSGGTIAPMEAVFVLYDSENSVTSVTFAKGAPSKVNSQLILNVTQGRSNVIDRAIIRFDEGSQLDKFQLFGNSTKIYIPQNTKEYAVVSAETQGEMPVNFKAESNGTYTISFSTENVSFNYLHLIDNMTGADIDLLANPSYSFNATTSDYESRFKLVFAAGNTSNDNNFAFFSDGNIIVNGEGMLQVIDMTGRIISTSQINGVSSINLNAAAGVYVLQLTNGENVKTQKIVVK